MHAYRVAGISTPSVIGKVLDHFLVALASRNAPAFRDGRGMFACTKPRLWWPRAKMTALMRGHLGPGNAGTHQTPPLESPDPPITGLNVFTCPNTPNYEHLESCPERPADPRFPLPETWTSSTASCAHAAGPAPRTQETVITITFEHKRWSCRARRSYERCKRPRHLESTEWNTEQHLEARPTTRRRCSQQDSEWISGTAARDGTARETKTAFCDCTTEWIPDELTKQYKSPAASTPGAGAKEHR